MSKQQLTPEEYARARKVEEYLRQTKPKEPLRRESILTE